MYVLLMPLHFFSVNGNLIRVTKDKKQIVILNEKEKEELFQKAHVGHVPLRNTLNKLTSKYYWKGMTEYVSEKVPTIQIIITFYISFQS